MSQSKPSEFEQIGQRASVQLVVSDPAFRQVSVQKLLEAAGEETTKAVEERARREREAEAKTAKAETANAKAETAKAKAETEKAKAEATKAAKAAQTAPPPQQMGRVVSSGGGGGGGSSGSSTVATQPVTARRQVAVLRLRLLHSDVCAVRARLGCRTATSSFTPAAAASSIAFTPSFLSTRTTTRRGITSGRTRVAARSNLTVPTTATPAVCASVAK